MYDSALPSSPLLPDDRPVPASVRGDSVVRAAFSATEGRTSLADLYQQGALRLRFPRGPRCEAVLVNTGGGITGGDRLSTTLSLAPDADVTATSQAAEKIYRSDGAPCEIAVSVALGAGSRLAWLPQETILYRRACVQRRLAIELAGDATLTVLEMLVLGRTAHGEVLDEASWLDRWDIKREGRLILAEAVRLDGDVAALMRRAAAGGGANAIATLVHVAPHAEARLADVRAALQGSAMPCAASAWNGMIVVRLLASSSHILRRDAGSIAILLTGGALPRAWNC